MPTFSGFRRQVGPAGIRNHVLVIPAELSCTPWAFAIADRAENCWAMTHNSGIGIFGSDRETFIRILCGIVSSPNVFGSVIVASGNEEFDPEVLVAQARACGRQVKLLYAQQFKSNAQLVNAGVQNAKMFLRQAASMSRVNVDVRNLRVGLNCAGTDVDSQHTSNALCGGAMDILAHLDATIVLSETPEMIGIEQHVRGRAASQTVRKKLDALIAMRKQRLTCGDESIDDREMCSFNRQGGLGTLKAKSRIAMLKAGTGVIGEVITYGQCPTAHGLVVMDGPALTDFVMTGFLGSGIHLMVNCCGSGPANRMPFLVGANGACPILPVIKVTGSEAYFRQRSNRIDFNAGQLSDEPQAIGVLTRKLYRMVIATASGKPTRTEVGRNYFVNIPIEHHQA